MSVVRETAATLGRAIADLVNFCNPARTVIGGDVTECTEDVLSQIRSVVYQQAQLLATRNLSVTHSTRGRAAVTSVRSCGSGRNARTTRRPETSRRR